ncbi:MAG: DHHW family protein [Bacilli bacterium]
MNKTTTIITTIIVFILLGVFVLTPKIKFSENENRYLQTVPILSLENVKTTKFMKDLEKYIEDHFPFRKFFISLKKDSELGMLKDENNNVFILKDEYLIEKYQQLKDETINNIANVLNTFKERNKTVNITTLLVPTSYSINKDKLPKFLDKELQLKDMNLLYDKITTNKLDITKSLYSSNKNEQLYFRLDHHWNINGAFVAYNEYLKSNNIKPLNKDEFEKVVLTKDFNGTVFSKSGEYNFKPDTIENYVTKSDVTVNYIYSNKITNSMFSKTYLNKKDKYAYFLDNNHPLITITNNQINSDKELLVIKDSYANILISLLANHYKKIHVIDPRFYKEDITAYIEANKIKDVLLLYNMNTIGNDTGIISIR